MKPMLEDGVRYVAMTPERIEALEKGLDAVNEWIYRDRGLGSYIHPMAQYINTLERMIREAKGEPEPVEDYEDEDDATSQA